MRTMLRQKYIGYICAFSAVFFWGFHSIIIRYLEFHNVHTYLIITSRLFIGAGFLSIFIVLQRLWKREKIFQPGKFRYGKFFWLAALALGLNFIFFHQGLNYTIASNAILLETFSSVMVLLLLLIFFPEKIRKFQTQRPLLTRLFFLVLLGSIGSALLIVYTPQDNTPELKMKTLGDLLEFVAMIFFALFFIGSSEHRKENSSANPLETSSRFLFVAGCLVSVLLPFSLSFENITAVTPEQWGLILLIGIFSTGVTYTLWYHASKYLDVVSLALMFNLSSVFTVLWESLFFHLQISWSIVLGAAFIIYASISAEMIMSKKTEEQLEEKKSMEP